MADSPTIPPAGIRLIREHREESRATFAAEIGVTSTTIGVWERGEGRPNSENHDAIIDAIPSELSMDAILNAEDRFEDDESRAYDKEQRLFGSKWLQVLRDEPRIGAELGDNRGLSVFSGQQRMFVKQLSLTSVEGSSDRDGDRVTSVYYLEGDERRALRRFIEENEGIVREQLQSTPNRFSHDWNEWLYALIEEEFRFWLYE